MKTNLLDIVKILDTTEILNKLIIIHRIIINLYKWLKNIIPSLSYYNKIKIL